MVFGPRHGILIEHVGIIFDPVVYKQSRRNRVADVSARWATPLSRRSFRLARLITGRCVTGASAATPTRAGNWFFTVIYALVQRQWRHVTPLTAINGISWSRDLCVLTLPPLTLCVCCIGERAFLFVTFMTLIRLWVEIPGHFEYFSITVRITISLSYRQ